MKEKIINNTGNWNTYAMNYMYSTIFCIFSHSVHNGLGTKNK